jgi:hypothetical protein
MLVKVNGKTVYHMEKVSYCTQTEVFILVIFRKEYLTDKED